MKFQKIHAPEHTLEVPEDCYRTAGVDLCAQVHASKNPMTLILPSLKNDIKMRFWFKIFVFDIERSSEENNITIKASGEERINGEQEIVLRTNGSCVMLTPVGADDWFCFIPSMPSAPPVGDAEFIERARESKLAEAPAEKTVVVAEKPVAVAEKPVAVAEKPSTNGAVKDKGVGGRPKATAVKQ